MERLTMRNSDGSVSQPTSTTVEAVFYRLAAYEDTGLTPEEITAMVASPNDPFTLDELRQMDGEPVYIKCLFNDELSSYTVLDEPHVDGNGIYTRLFYAAFESHEDDWLAYRRKPERFSGSLEEASASASGGRRNV